MSLIPKEAFALLTETHGDMKQMLALLTEIRDLLQAVPTVNNVSILDNGSRRDTVDSQPIEQGAS